MKGGKRPLGYTIIEVMIVLAVSGIMFLIAATFISGKQERTSFTEGVNQMASQIQDTIAQVTNGQYSDIPLNCSAVGGFVNFPLTTPLSDNQGRNPGCTFLGKVLHFSVGGNASNYEAISIAGSRLDPLGNPSTSPNDGDAQYIPGLTDQQTVPQNLSVMAVRAIDSGGSHQPSFGVGFLQSQANLNTTDNVLENQAQTVSLYYVSGMTSNMTGDTGGGAGEAQIHSNLYAAQSVEICLTDGTRWADIALGADVNNPLNTNDPLSVTVNMDGTTEPMATCT